jgi:hypothetical protein
MKHVGGKRDDGYEFQIVACWMKMMDASDAKNSPLVELSI